MKRPIVSVIVPVYNVESFLPNCMDSLLSQTLMNIEIICVDDGSTDKSGEILDQYAQKDQRIVVIHQENAGAAAARNTGLRIAKGIYIGFSDSDDSSEASMYELMVSEAEKQNADLVFCGAKLIPERPRAAQWLFESLSPNRRIIEKQDVKFCFSDIQTNNFLWRTLIRTQIIREHSIMFDEGVRLGEDKLFLCQLTPYASRISVMPDKLYHYHWHRENSLMATLANVIHPQKLEEHILLIDRLTDCVIGREIKGEREELFQWMIPFLYSDFIYQNRNDKINFSIKIDKLAKKINKYYFIMKSPDYMVEDYYYMERFKALEKEKFPYCSVIFYLDERSEYIREMTQEIARYADSRAEFILINNGVSRDNYAHLKNLMESNCYVRLYNTPEHLQRYEALNKGIVLANGTYMIFANSYNFLRFEKLVSCIKDIMEENAELCMTGGEEGELCYENEFAPLFYRTEWLKEQKIQFGDDSILDGKIFEETAKKRAHKLMQNKEQCFVKVRMSNTEWYGKIEGAKFLGAIQKLVDLAKIYQDEKLCKEAYTLFSQDFCRNLMQYEFRPNGDYYLNEEKKVSNQVEMIKLLYKLIYGVNRAFLEKAGITRINDLYNVLWRVVSERQKMLNQ